jgi:predicted metal-dependent enzyme (double-stranded beta helix superfamily)/rhodanese-related sulfurtransferase
MTGPGLSRLERFVADFASLLEDDPPEPQLLESGGALLGALVARDDWLPAAFAASSPPYAQHLLYCDPAERFSVVSFVWSPGRATPVHNHTVWGLVGLLRGAEISQPFSLTPDGLVAGEPRHLRPGDVEALSPRIGDIHRVVNGLSDRESVSVHVYGADIGRVERSTFTSAGEARPFVSGYSSRATPILREPPCMMIQVAAEDVRRDLLARREIALLDVREEDPFARGHPLFAANLPLSRLEIDAFERLPRRDVRIVLYDDGEGLVAPAAERLGALGYSSIGALRGGLAGWKAAGFELFQDVNSASKAFGELVEARRHTPSLAAPEAKALIEGPQPTMVLDARRFDEYRTMSIPTGVSVPGAELVLRARSLAPDPATTIIVNCAGRTRSLIGAQSLINAGMPNPVVALRNGTMGWTLAGQGLQQGQGRRYGEPEEAREAEARFAAREVAYRAGVRRLRLADLDVLAAAPDRTLYRFDPRQPEEYEAGHLPEFRNVPGGQLVQETDHVAPVRGARIVLADPRGVRADMTASWLAQMGWEVYVLDAPESAFSALGPAPRLAPVPPPVVAIEPDELAALLEAGEVDVVDLGPSPAHRRVHVPGAWFAIRARLARDLAKVEGGRPLVLTSPDGLLARFAAADVEALTGVAPRVLQGGTAAWVDAGLPLETGMKRAASASEDVYRRPYEGTENAANAMQAYLDWEFGLVDQLARDATHGFYVI